MNLALSPTFANSGTPRFGQNNKDDDFATYAKSNESLLPELEDTLDLIAPGRAGLLLESFLDQPFVDDQGDAVSLLGKQIQNKHILTLVANFLRNSDTNLTPRDLSGILKNTFNTLFGLFHKHAEKLDHNFSFGVQRVIDKMLELRLLTQKDQALQLTDYGKGVAKIIESESQ